jgi:very-short-patch-repair endonuclease
MKTNKIQQHNREVINSAEFRASEMKTWPSPLEEKMKGLLEKYHIEYEWQKISYIKADDGWIIRYYIADFYIPKFKIIVEVDGKFHDKQKGYDKKRTKDIQEAYPYVGVIRFKWDDLKDDSAIFMLLSYVNKVV